MRFFYKDTISVEKQSFGQFLCKKYVLFAAKLETTSEELIDGNMDFPVNLLRFQKFIKMKGITIFKRSM